MKSIPPRRARPRPETDNARPPAKRVASPLVGAEGTAALRVGLSALVLIAIWRPWRFRLTRADAGRVFHSW